jgi:hypothetical protein
MTGLRKPKFKSMSNLSDVGGAPILRSLWERFDLSLLLTQSGIFKASGVATWILAFLYVIGLIAGCTSVNNLASFYKNDGLLQRMFNKKSIIQSTLSRFLTGFGQWDVFNAKRTQRLQNDSETALRDGDVIALDDTHVDHPYAEKIPFLYWLFDSSRKIHIWAMNLVVLHAICKNGLEYPWSYAIWKKRDDETDPQETKLDLALQMLAVMRKQVSARLWLVMDRWYLSKPFLRECESMLFDWVTKAKRNTALFRLVIEPGTMRKRYVPIKPRDLIREVFPRLKMQASTGVAFIACPGIYMKMPVPYINRKGKLSSKMKYAPVAAVAGMRLKKNDESEQCTVTSSDEENAAEYRGAYLLLSNRHDAPKEVLDAWLKRWNIEVLFRTAKQELGMSNCHSASENHIHAHFTLLFTAETLVRYLLWTERKTAGEDDCTHGQVIRNLLCIRCQISRNVTEQRQQSITIDIDTVANRFARIIDKLWPTTLEVGWFCTTKSFTNHYLEATA